MWPTIPGGLGEMWYISETNKISLFSGLKGLMVLYVESDLSPWLDLCILMKVPVG